ncbi:DUF3488 and transglutaminase-like domain-containing protein [Silanimonas sp.]|uniref:transglutaminase TgpA family protein n=1 Tax=Silanimonas sp. TaxID=1929290 RepID=UPI0025DAEB33|nr:DUF3488 and transglutaminase-like domain-containing protein [Silanimonas sp.]
MSRPLPARREMPALPLRRVVVAAVLAASLPLLLHVPGLVAAGIAVLAVLAGASALRRPLPIGLRVLLVLLVSFGVLAGFDFRLGRDAGSALLLAMLLLKLAELRDIDDARRLVGFALFAPFAAFLQDQGPLTLALGLQAGAASLFALARLARAPAEKPALASEWRQLGALVLLGLPLAAAAFWLFPRLPTPLWGLPENAVARTGIGDSMSPGDWIDLMADDSPAFRVRFEGPQPPSEQLYWRGPVLSHFDGRTWRRDPRLAALPPPALPVAAEGGIAYTLTLEPTDRRFVFALESPAGWPAQVQVDGEASLLAREPLRGLAQFQLRALPVQAFQPELPEALRRAYLALPPGYNPRSLARAEAWRAEAADARGYITRVLGWFNAEHIYSISAPPLGRHTADGFLFDTREGFCEHFASAFVVLMRGAGLPARVVTGYVGGVRNPIGGHWIVRQMDAHAWAEVWLEGEGWVRVDPTAAVAPERIFDTLEDRAAGGIAAGLQPMLDLGDTLREAWNHFVVRYDALRQVQLLERLGVRNADPLRVGIAFALAALLALGLSLALLLRRQDHERDPLLRAWRAYLRRWARRGFSKRPEESAQAFATRVGRSVPEAATPLGELVARWNALRYADPAASAQARAELARALRRAQPGPARPGPAFDGP